MKKHILLIILLAFTNQAFSVGNAGGAQLEIREIWGGGYPSNADRTYTRLSLATPHIDTECSNQNIIVIRSAPTGIPGVRNEILNEVYEQQYAIALAALINGNKVRVFLAGCTPDGLYSVALRLSVVR